MCVCVCVYFGLCFVCVCERAFCIVLCVLFLFFVCGVCSFVYVCARAPFSCPCVSANDFVRMCMVVGVHTN